MSFIYEHFLIPSNDALQHCVYCPEQCNFINLLVGLFGFQCVNKYWILPLGAYTSWCVMQNIRIGSSCYYLIFLCFIKFQTIYMREYTYVYRYTYIYMVLDLLLYATNRAFRLAFVYIFYKSCFYVFDCHSFYFFSWSANVILNFEKWIHCGVLWERNISFLEISTHVTGYCFFLFL